MLQLQHRRPAQISVGIVAVSESKTVDTAVALVVCCSVVQEPANTSTSSAVGINDKSKAVKLAHSIDTGGANPGLTVFGVP